MRPRERLMNTIHVNKANLLDVLATNGHGASIFTKEIQPFPQAYELTGPGRLPDDE